MNEDYNKTQNIIHSLHFGKNVLNELKNYQKYLTYCGENKINLGNKNWLIIDSSKTSYQILVDEITKIAIPFKYTTNIILDTDFYYKEKVDEKSIRGAFLRATFEINILVVSNMSEDVAMKKYSDKCTFFANLDSQISKVDKQDEIEKILLQNRFSMSKKLVEQISNYKTSDIERMLTRAFILALDDETNKIKDTYLFDKKKSLKSNLKELNDVVGLNDVKTTIKEIINYLNVCKDREDLPCLNFAFMGNPGTGKTSIARIFGKILSSYEILSYNTPFVEVSREDLVGRFIGSSEDRTIEKINQAVGGILFIDEAYSLCSDDSKQDFGHRVIDVLVKQIDLHKNELCVIFAGYKSEMQNFLKTNTGLDSRIPFKIEFPNYNEEELYKILIKFFKLSNLLLTRNCKKTVISHFKEVMKQQDFGNGRYVRNFVERIKIKQANRLHSYGGNTNVIVEKDIQQAINSFKKIEEVRRHIGF